MLGKTVHDPDGIEGAPGSTPGLGLLHLETVMAAPKVTARTRFLWDKTEGSGYEIHMGQTDIKSGQRPFSILDRNGTSICESEGCMSSDGRVFGTYIHGLFDAPEITCKWLKQIGLGDLKASDRHGYRVRDKNYDRLADHFISHMDMDKILKLAVEKLL